MAYPDTVIAVNKIVSRPDGSTLTDYDIELDHYIIQVKEGTGKGATRQALNTATSTTKEVLIYLPDRKPTDAIVRGLNSKGFRVFHSIDDILKFIERTRRG